MLNATCGICYLVPTTIRKWNAKCAKIFTVGQFKPNRFMFVFTVNAQNRILLQIDDTIIAMHINSTNKHLKCTLNSPHTQSQSSMHTANVYV